MSGTTGILLDAIEYPANTRDDVAQRYAWAIQRGDADWPVVNAAIIARWSKSGLEYIKRKAWSGEHG